VYSFVITAEVRRRQEIIIPKVASCRRNGFLNGYNTCDKLQKRKTSMNLAFFFTLLFLAIAGSAYMTYFEHGRARRHSKKKRKNKVKVA
jgi:hypothetical protein